MERAESRMPAQFPFAGSAPQSIVLPIVANELVITNDSSAPLVVTAGDKFTPNRFVVTIPAGFTMDERIDPFDRISVTSASGPYTGYVRRAADEWRFCSEYLYR
ncbi:hypothetical protein [Paenibacillus hamazuiensis]|uniref:hypothetical protein n=1 Tax=Paenibacillus hamazuiensis TaxID=2936508 RepID=UPI00200EA07E|nr:hypothetical protein [Paenibacillus hamazuiensis]